MPRPFASTLPAVIASLALIATAAGAQTWQPAPAFPDTTQAREYAVGLQVADVLYALGGTPFSANLDSPVHQLPTAGTTWLPAPELEGTIIHHGAGVDALGRIVVFGGLALIGDDEGKGYYWDPIEGKQGNTAERGSSAPLEFFAWATDDAQRIYSLGGGPGAVATPGDPNSAFVERYDGAADIWQPVAPMNSAVADAAAVNDGRGHILVLGGFVASGGGRTTNVAQYDIATDTWSDTAVADLPAALSSLRAVLGADDRVYAIGGTNGTTQGTTWVLDQDADVWTAGPDLATPRAGFAAALSPDDHIYVMGGSNDGGGTHLVEKLYTPPCPLFAPPLPAPTPWVGQTTLLSVDVAGGTPLSYRWQRDGLDLFDGPSASGAVLTGTDTPDLMLSGTSLADSGDYALRATNPCGTATSPVLALNVRVPVSPGATWATWNLHPAGSLSSTALGLDDGQVVGSTGYTHPTYGTLSRPMLWTDPAAAPLDLTPPGSVGGSIAAVENGVQVGWYWWPYTTPQGTGYNQHASLWSGSVASHVNMQPSGWEFGSLADTDGSQHVGTMRYDESSTNSAGTIWNFPSASAFTLTPPTMWGSSTTSVDAGRQFGQVHIGFGVVHAAQWAGNAASFVDMNPPGSSWSYITAAGDGQQVGRATFAGVNKPLLWGGQPEGTLDLTPPGGTATLSGVAHGLQVGSASLGAGTGAGLWSGSAASFTSLHGALGRDFTASFATDVDVDAFGTISISGYGINSVTTRTEALLWRSNAQPLSADVESIDSTTGGTQSLQLFAGPEHAGKTYFFLGSVSGTEPGIGLNPWTHLPLNFDAYLQFLFFVPNSSLMPLSLGTLDDHGMAQVEFVLPPGLSLSSPLTLHHAYLVLDTNDNPLMASNPVALTLLP